MTVQNPHDKFFRESFSRLDVARNFLTEYLPPDILVNLQLDTLQLQSDSFIDEKLQSHQTDILYETQLADESTTSIYLLFEHKSYPDSKVALQLLRYMVRICERQQESKQTLQPIIPIVIYHGERIWTVKTDFQSLFPDLPDSMKPHVPQFDYLVRDFSYRSELELRGDVWLLTILLVLRSILSPTIRAELPQLVKIMMTLAQQQHGLDFVYTILYYLTDATDKVSKQHLRQTLDQHTDQGEAIMATLAQQWIQEGQQKQARTVAINLLRLLADEQISAATGLSLAEVKELRQAEQNKA